LLSVHAHPDDEASKGAPTVARYHAEGVHTVLVCCTGGEAGDILNPAMDTPDVRSDIYAVRMRELAASAEAIGYDAVHLLGYHDSGMPDTDVNHRPDNFANAPLDEAVGRLVVLIRAERPQVIVTYADDRSFYPHPDHIRVHEISLPAFEAAGDPDAFPDAGEPWTPSKLYYTGFSRRRVQAMHDEFVRRGSGSSAASPIGTTASRRSSTSDRGSTGAASRCSRTAPRSIRRATGCACRTTRSGRSSPGTSTRSPGRGSGRCRRPTPRTICSPGCAPRRPCAPRDPREP
jgi:mycothiol conjugate amidase Mca